MMTGESLDATTNTVTNLTFDSFDKQCLLLAILVCRSSIAMESRVTLLSKSLAFICVLRSNHLDGQPLRYFRLHFVVVCGSAG